MTPPHPTIAHSKDKNLWEDLQHYTKNIPDDPPGGPGERIYCHFKTVKSRWAGTVNNKQPGMLFEWCVYDALVYHGIAPENIRTNVDLSVEAKIRTSRDPNGIIGKRVDADILIDNIKFIDGTETRAALMCKTSCRERRDGWERDGFIAKMYVPDTRLFGVWLRERDEFSKRGEQTPKECAEQSQRMMDQMVCIIHLVSVREDEAIRKLWREFGCVV